MNIHHAEIPNNSALYKLIVIEGSEKGIKIDLAAGRKYLIGRGEDCDIRIDASDKTVSRKHAVVEASYGQVAIENLSTANPVRVKGKPVQKVTLKDKGQFRIGNTLYVLRKAGTTADSGRTDSGKGIPPYRVLVIAVLVLICLAFIFIIMSGGDAPEVRDTGIDMTRSATNEPLPDITTQPETHRTVGGFEGLGIDVSAEEKRKADEHFRKGMFFYDTGNIARAVAEWNRAVILYPDHPDAQAWFLRAEKELAEKVKTHYQNAMLHYKYMRYDDAAHEFRLVLELSKDKTSEQYINALKLLNEIQGR